MIKLMKTKKVEVHNRHDYTFCLGKHIRNCAIVFIVLYFLDYGFMFVGRLLQPNNSTILHQDGELTMEKLYVVLMPRFHYAHLLFDIVALVCGITFLIAIVKKNSKLVLPMRIFMGFIFFVWIILAGLFLIGTMLSFAGVFRQQSKEKIDTSEEFVRLLSLYSPFALLFLALMSTLFTVCSYWVYRLTTRFQEYLQDVESGETDHKAGVRLVTH